MTDTTPRGEAAGFCPGCGCLVAVRLADTHKRRGCTARLDNTFRQWRDQHAGAHHTLDTTLESFDKDIDAIFKRQDAIEDHNTSSSGQAGITVTGDLDDTDPGDTDLPEEPTAPARQPLTNGDVPQLINPLTGLPR